MKYERDIEAISEEEAEKIAEEIDNPYDEAIDEDGWVVERVEEE